MKIVGREALVNFKKKHGACRSRVDEWIKEVESAEWKMNNVRLIHTEKEYDEAMREVLTLAKTNPAEGMPRYEQVILPSMLIAKNAA